VSRIKIRTGFLGVMLLLLVSCREPSDHPECIFKNMKGVSSDTAAEYIAIACTRKHAG
jgi:hypothetical protein